MYAHYNTPCLVDDLRHPGVVREFPGASVLVGVLPEREEVPVGDELLEPRHHGQVEQLTLGSLGLREPVDEVDDRPPDLLGQVPGGGDLEP